MKPDNHITLLPRDRLIISGLILLAVALAVVVAILFSGGCSPHPVAYPISSSHSQLTATDYDLAEAEFSGGLAPLPDALAAMECQEILNKRDNISAAMFGICGATGGAGLGTLIPKDVTPEERKKWDISLGAVTLALGIACTTMAAVVKNLSERFESQCATKPASVEPVEVPTHPGSDEVEQDGGPE
jgi:hypothetical protein